MNAKNTLFLKSAFIIASKTKAKALLIDIDILDDIVYPETLPRGVQIILVTKKKKPKFDDDAKRSLHKRADAILTLPKINLSRISIIKVSVLLALTQGHIQEGDLVVCTVGHTVHDNLDCIQLIDTGYERDLITYSSITKAGKGVNPEVFQAVLNMSVELADEGREGKPVGTIFVVGDEKHVMQFSKQMIINPFKGYNEDERNILNKEMRETLREFSSLDGAFVINGKGTVVTAGRFLSTVSDEATLSSGLGSRHIAAAGITTLTNAVAFVISESSGDVRIFKRGKVLMEIEKSSSRKNNR